MNGKYMNEQDAVQVGYRASKRLSNEIQSFRVFSLKAAGARAVPMSAPLLDYERHVLPPAGRTSGIQ